MKAFVIRKPGDEMSEKFADECIESAKKFEITVEKFDGVYSNHDDYINSRKLRFFEKMKEHRKTNPGIKGCFLSHYLLWEKCIELNEPVMIFEHDALMIRSLPDNILDLFSHHCILDYAVHYPNYEEIISNNCDLTVKTFNKIKTAQFGFKQVNSTHVKGSHAHIVKPLGAETLIKSIKQHGILPADMVVNQYYTSYITIDPLIARCHPFFSDASNRKKFGHVN